VERKLKTSFLLLVLVRVGAVLAGHFTLAGQVTLRAVPSAVKIKEKPILAPDGGLDNVNVVILALRLHVNKLQVFKSIVNVLLLIEIDCTFSEYLPEVFKLFEDKPPVVNTPVVVRSLFP
jgi:hypothetical protein